MLVVALLIAACGVPDVAQQVPPEAAADAPAAIAAPPTSAITASIASLAARELPDGLGGTIAAKAPVALSLGGGWGGRALDPVLVVGERRFTEYEYPAPGVLRYTLPERSLLEEGGAAVQWSEGERVVESLDVSAAVQEALR